MIDLAAGTAFDGRGPILILLFPAIFLIHTGKNTFFSYKNLLIQKKSCNFAAEIEREIYIHNIQV